MKICEETEKSYKCTKCRDMTFILVENEALPCECRALREAEDILKKSGIGKEFRNKRFDNFDFSRSMATMEGYKKAMDYENEFLDDPDFIIELATKLKYEREQRRLLEEKAKHLEATITIDKPYTNFGKSIATSSDAITIGQFAKVLNNNNINIGRNRLFTILRDNGYLIKVGKDKNMPKQIYVKQGLFKVAESIVKTVKGELLTATTLITGKGQMYFLELFSNLTENKTYIS
jgi:phage antirepressor YoqD-like protein